MLVAQGDLRMFIVFGAFHFPFKRRFKKLQNHTFFWLWRRDPVLEQALARRSFCLADVALEWLRHSCSALPLRMYFYGFLQLAAC